MKKLIKTNTLVHLAISDEEKRLLILAPGGKAETGTARKGSSHLQSQVQSLSKAHLAKVTTTTDTYAIMNSLAGNFTRQSTLMRRSTVLNLYPSVRGLVFWFNYDIIPRALACSWVAKKRIECELAEMTFRERGRAI